MSYIIMENCLKVTSKLQSYIEVLTWSLLMLTVLKVKWKILLGKKESQLNKYNSLNIRVLSVFDGKQIDIWSYNLETILAEKIETILSRGELSTRPRDRYDVFVLTQLNGDMIDYIILSQVNL